MKKNLILIAIISLAMAFTTGVFGQQKRSPNRPRATVKHVKQKVANSASEPFDRGYLPPALKKNGTVNQVVFEGNDEPLWVRAKKINRRRH